MDLSNLNIYVAIDVADKEKSLAYKRAQTTSESGVSLKESHVAFPNLIRSQNREINDTEIIQAALSTAAKTPVIFQSHMVTRNTNVAIYRLDEI